MELLEFVVQGVQGFPELTRVPLSSGLTLVQPADERGRVLIRVLLSLLYPKGSDPDLADLVLPVENAGQQQARVGITLQGRDGAIYRILQDAATGRRSLLKTENGQQVALSKTSAAIAQAVTAVIGFPQEDVLTGVFITRREDLPSQRPEVRAPRSNKHATQQKSDRPAPAGFSDIGKPAPPGLATSPASAAARGVVNQQSELQIYARLEEIEEQLVQLERVRDVEFEMDGIVKLGFELDQRLEPFTALQRAVAAALKQASRFDDLAALPADLLARADGLRAIEQQHQREMGRYDEDRVRLVGLLGYDPENDEGRRRRPFWQEMLEEPPVKYGLVGGATAIALGFLGAAMYQPLRWVALLDIPALGAALFGAMRFLADYESSIGTRSRLDRLMGERARQASRFELDESNFKLILQSHDLTVEQLPDIEHGLAERTKALAELDAVQQALDITGGTDELASLEAQKIEQQARFKVLEEELTTLTSSLGGARELEEERTHLQRILNGESNPPGGAPEEDESGYLRGPQPSSKTVPTAGEVPTSGIAPTSGVFQTGVAVEDLCQSILKLAADLMMVPLEIVIEQLVPRASQYLSGLTDRRYSAVQCEGNGAFAAVETASNTAIPYGALTPGDRDLAYLAMKLTVVEASSRKVRIPVIIDGGFEAFPEPKDPLIVRMLQYLGAVTQVMCMTNKTALMLASPQQVKLP